MTEWLARAAEAWRPAEMPAEAHPIDPQMLFAGDHEWRWTMCHRHDDDANDSVNDAQHSLQGPFSG